MEYKGEENACVFNLASSIGAYVLQVGEGASEGPYSTLFRSPFRCSFPSKWCRRGALDGAVVMVPEHLNEKKV